MHQTRFRNKTVVLTGAGSELGKAMAIRYAYEGAELILIDEDTDGLMVTLNSLPEDPSWLHEEHHKTIACHTYKHDQIDKLIPALDEEFDHIDVLVDVATQDNDIYLEKKLLPYLAKSNGNILYVSSQFNQLNIEQMQELAIKHRADGVNVNQVSFPKDMQAISAKQKKHLQTSKSALSRQVNFEDVIDLVTFLTSHEADMITGIHLPLEHNEPTIG